MSKWILIMVIAMQAGCVKGRESLHEMDHVQPPHWPSDLKDAQQKIQERLEKWGSTTGAESEKQAGLKELRDLVGWIPEIAADTELTEAEWNPIYEAAEAGRQVLKGPASLDEVRQKIDKLAEALGRANELLVARQAVLTTEAQ